MEYQEITLKDILLKLIEYAGVIWSKKVWVLFSIIIAVALSLKIERDQGTTYSGELTFSLNEEGSSPLGGIGSVLGSLGLGASSGGTYNPQKIVELSKSRLINHKVMMDSVIVNNVNDRLIHHLLTTYATSWQESIEKPDSIKFIDNDFESMDRTQRKTIQFVHKKIIGSNQEAGLIKVIPDIGTGIIRIEGRTVDEELTQNLIGELYRHVSMYYINKVTANPQQVVKNLTEKSDSVKSLLQSVEYQLANLKDRSLGTTLNRDRLKEEQLSRRVQMLSVIYGEILKNLGVAEFSLGNITPVFVVIDKPFLPLNKSSPKYLKSLITGMLAGLFIAITIISFVKLTQDTLK